MAGKATSTIMLAKTETKNFQIFMKHTSLLMVPTKAFTLITLLTTFVKQPALYNIMTMSR
uniref:E3 6.7 kDa protein n=1 Tax=Human adenovirus F serotype 41 TaxID=10524 RepID=Q98838_ADE41|nr:E3 6.7 kd protein [Human adenovirus 41]CAA36446.1 E3 6.7 kDa protein [Human adenovirus 41]prf//2209404C RL3 gene [Human adenovirus 41]